GAAHDRGADRPPRRRAQDRERRARKRLRHSRRGGGHPRHEAVGPPRAHRAERRGQDRVRAHERRAARALDALLPLADSPRSPCLRRPQAALLDLPARGELPAGRGRDRAVARPMLTRPLLPALGMLALAWAAPARADVTQFPPTWLGHESVAAVEGAAAVGFNPAALGTRYPSELLVSWTDAETGPTSFRALAATGRLG